MNYVIDINILFVELVGAIVAEPHEAIEFVFETCPLYDESDRVGEALR